MTLVKFFLLLLGWREPASPQYTYDGMGRLELFKPPPPRPETR